MICCSFAASSLNDSATADGDVSINTLFTNCPFSAYCSQLSVVTDSHGSSNPKTSLTCSSLAASSLNDSATADGDVSLNSWITTRSAITSCHRQLGFVTDSHVTLNSDSAIGSI